MMQKLFIVAMFVLALIGCDNKKREVELQEKISKLEDQLEECQNGADKIYAKMKLSCEEKNFKACKELFEEMKQRHPESDLFNEVKAMYDKSVAEEEKIREQERLLLEKKEREAQIKAKKEKDKKLKALKKLRKKFDDVNGVTWYHNPYFKHYNNSNLTSLYIGNEKQSTWVRLVMSYEGDNWIFFERAYLSYDGKTKEIFFEKYEDKKTENGSGGVWEWIDISINAGTIDFLRSFAKSKNAKMRLSGKYTKTRNLTYDERKGIIDVLNGYDALTKK